MKRYSSILIILALILATKTPLESSIQKDRKELKYNTGRFTLGMRQQIKQLGAVAILGGFRGVVCDFVWIAAHGSWEKQEWFKMKQYFEVVTSLQPMSVLYLETSAWHMAWNISYSVSQNPKEPRAAKRELARRQWIEEGRKFLEKGIENIPEKYDLYFHLGWLIMQKQDYLDAQLNQPGLHYLEAAKRFQETWQKFPNEAPTYVSRMVGHCYMKAEQWQMARDWWCGLLKEDPQRTKHPDQMWHKIEEWGRECEDHLALAGSQRCFPPKT